MKHKALTAFWIVGAAIWIRNVPEFVGTGWDVETAVGRMIAGLIAWALVWMALCGFDNR